MAKAKPGLGYVKGVELEYRVKEQAESLGQIIIKEPNHTNRNEHGFDVVSFDPKANKLHIFEAKSGDYVSMSKLGTFLNAWGDDEEKKGKLYSDRLSTGLLAHIPKESLARSIIEECINQNRMEYHLVGERDTEFSKNILGLATK